MNNTSTTSTIVGVIWSGGVIEKTVKSDWTGNDFLQAVTDPTEYRNERASWSGINSDPTLTEAITWWRGLHLNDDRFFESIEEIHANTEEIEKPKYEALGISFGS